MSSTAQRAHKEETAHELSDVLSRAPPLLLAVRQLIRRPASPLLACGSKALSDTRQIVSLMSPAIASTHHGR
jgi:hypothetical protein